MNITHSHKGASAVILNGGRDILLGHNHFIKMGQNAIDYNGGTRVAIVGNTFLDASQDTDVTYSTIDVAANQSEWRIEGNTFRLRAGISNKPLRQITIAAGTSTKFILGDNDYGVAGTDFGAAGATAVSDGSTGTNVILKDSLPTLLYRGDTAITHTGTTDSTVKDRKSVV